MRNIIMFALLPIILILSFIFLFNQTTQANWKKDNDPPTPAISITCGTNTFSSGNSSQNRCSGSNASISISCTDPGPSFSSGCQTTTYTIDGGTPVQAPNNTASTTINDDSNTHSISVTSVDNTGHTSTISVSFTFSIPARPAWIQTSGGDVHSNTTIDTQTAP